MKARFGGWCNLCRSEYDSGTEITKYQGRWVHAACVGAKAVAAPSEEPRPASTTGHGWVIGAEGQYVTLRFPYSEQAVGAVKSIMPSARRYDGETKTWRVHSSQFDRLVKLLEKVNADVARDLETLPALESVRKLASVTEATRALSRASEAELDIPVPAGLRYLPFQRAGIAFAMSRPNTLFGDEMGVGKTIQAIGTINADPTVSRVLVICPNIVKVNWLHELRKWLVRPMTVEAAWSKSWPDSDVVVCNYDILKNFDEQLHSAQFDLLVLDEVHYAKNPKAGRTKAIFGDYKTRKAGIRARRRLALSGTPIPNRPIELWTLVSAFDPDGLGRNWKYFAERYCEAKKTRWGWETKGAANLGELQDRLRSSIMVRRLKSQVLTELPTKRRQVIEIPAGLASSLVRNETKVWAAGQERIDQARARLELAKAEENEAEYKAAVAALREVTRYAFTEMARARHETALAKVQHVIEHVREAIRSSGKVIVFAHHRDVIEQIRQQLTSPGDEDTEAYRVVTITGGGDAKRNYEIAQTFQDDPDVSVLIGQITAAGVGITLTAASNVIFAELDWVPGNLSQCEDRAHRIGQTRMVLVQHVVLQDSFDAKLAHDLVAKQAVQEKALDDPYDLGIRSEDDMTIDEIEGVIDAVAPGAAPATSSVARKQLHREAADMTEDQIAAVHAALRAVAGMCDGARELDGAGFSKIDAVVGRALAMLPELLPGQAALGRHIVRKYRRQYPVELLERMEGGKAEPKRNPRGSSARRRAR